MVTAIQTAIHDDCEPDGLEGVEADEGLLVVGLEDEKDDGGDDGDVGEGGCSGVG